MYRHDQATGLKPEVHCGSELQHISEICGLGFDASVYVAALAVTLQDQARLAAEQVLGATFHAPHSSEPGSKEFSLHAIYAD